MKKQELTIQETKLIIPIYDHHLKIVVTNNVPKYLDKEGFLVYKVSEFDRAIVIDTFLIKDCPYEYVLVINKAEIHNEGILCHEAFHIACRTMEFIGVKLTKVSEEAFAYLLEHIYKGLRVKLIQLDKKE